MKPRSAKAKGICIECGKEVERYASRMTQFKFCSPSCRASYQVKQGGAFGAAENSNDWNLEKHPRWKGGRSIIGKGYVRISIGKGIRVLESRIVMEKHLGRPLQRNEHIRHINGDLSDNSIGNLEIWKKEPLPKPDRTRSAIAKANNRKGKDYEREMAEFFTNITGVEWRRTPMSGAMSGMKFDLMKMRNVPTPFDDVGIEVKNYSKISSHNVIDWIKQCEAAADDMGHPNWLLIFKFEGENYFLLPQRYFERLGRELSGFIKEEYETKKREENQGT